MKCERIASTGSLHEDSLRGYHDDQAQHAEVLQEACKLYLKTRNKQCTGVASSSGKKKGETGNITRLSQHVDLLAHGAEHGFI